MFIKYALLLALGLVSSFAKAECSDNSSLPIKEGSYKSEFDESFCPAKISMTDDGDLTMEFQNEVLTSSGEKKNCDAYRRKAVILKKLSDKKYSRPRWMDQDNSLCIERLNEDRLAFYTTCHTDRSSFYILTFFQLPESTK